MNQQTDNGISFNALRKVLKHDVYASLPHYQVRLSAFFKRFYNLFLYDCLRTLKDSRDLIEPFNRLIHKNGIALLGTWTITEPSPYSGYFKQDSKGLIVVRASVGHTATTPGGYRSFGFAGKIFPTLDPDASVKTASFVTMNDVTGDKIRFYNDAVMSNQTHIALNNFFFKQCLMLLMIVINFIQSDDEPTWRPVDAIAQLGESDSANIIAPHWLKIIPSKENRPSDALDFRDELKIDTTKNETLKYDIYAAPKTLKNNEQDFQRFGFIQVNESIASLSVDNRLHFKHDKVRA